MEVEKIEAILKLMQKYNAQKLNIDGLSIEVDTDKNDTMTPEVLKALQDITKTEQASDEEILYNPYAGMEIDNG